MPSIDCIVHGQSATWPRHRTPSVAETIRHQALSVGSRHCLVLTTWAQVRAGQFHCLSATITTALTCVKSVQERPLASWQVVGSSTKWKLTACFPPTTCDVDWLTWYQSITAEQIIQISVDGQSLCLQSLVTRLSKAAVHCKDWAASDGSGVRQSSGDETDSGVELCVHHISVFWVWVHQSTSSVKW